MSTSIQCCFRLNILHDTDSSYANAITHSDRCLQLLRSFLRFQNKVKPEAESVWNGRKWVMATPENERVEAVKRLTFVLGSNVFYLSACKNMFSWPLGLLLVMATELLFHFQYLLVGCVTIMMTWCCVGRLSERSEEKAESGKSFPSDKSERETAKVSVHVERYRCCVLCSLWVVCFFYSFFY